ncbi:MAG: putative repeat protein (TIGR01451 family), partial [Saprospiraceae bacterium]
MTKKFMLFSLATFLVLLFSILSFSQTANLGILSSFEAFTAAGDITNSGGTVTGDAGTHVGSVIGSYDGNTYSSDAVTDQARKDLLRLYIHLNDLFVDFPSTHSPTFGGGEVLDPGVYSISSAGSIGGSLTLDGGGDPNAFFIIKFNGALTGTAGATITLTGGVQSCNIFWLVNGAISIGAGADLKGTLFSKSGAVGLGANVLLEGRMFSMSGAITYGTGSVAVKPSCTSTIPIFCEPSCDPASAVDVLGVLSDFALFTSAGIVGNTGASGINGNIGTNAGAITGFASGIHIGTQEIANALTAQAVVDLEFAYSSLMMLPATAAHTAVFLNETLSPGVYDIFSAATLSGLIILDAEGDPDAIFVVRVAGAFNVAALSKMILTNGARRCNIFWIGGAGVATGAVNIGAASEVKGNFISHAGACSAGAGVFLAGKQLSTAGAVNTNTPVIYINPECVTSLPLTTLETDCADGIDNDGDGYIDGADSDCAEAPPLQELTNDPVVNVSMNSWGISAVDFNDDGYDDIFVPAYVDTVKNKLFLNDGSGSFTEHMGGDLVNDLFPTVASSWGDFDNDGQIDVVIANNVGDPIQLYKNNNQTFVNQSSALIGLADGYTHNVCFVDFDRDGWLDIFASDYFGTNFNHLYRNRGDGTMELTYGLEIVSEASNSIGAIWADVNNDGWSDCFIPNYGTSNVLYINQEGTSFSAIEMGDLSNSVGASFGDFDNDLDLDLFVANASDQHNFLYTNDGNGNFTKVITGWVAEDKGNSHGSVWADLDNDSWLDLAVMNDLDGSKFLYMNNGDGTFGKVTDSPFVSPVGNSFAIASTDLELDGDIDLVISNHSNESNRVFVNNLATGHYLIIRLEGTNSNRSAIGARIYVNAVIDGVNTTVMREVMGQTGGGPGSQSTLNQHFGLSDATAVISVVVHWPSGYVQTMNSISADQFLSIKEDDGALVSGHLYHDSNSNCTKDEGELPISNTMIIINSGSIYAISNDSGYYEISLPVGSYNIQQDIPENYESICQPSPHNVNVTSVGQVLSGFDFPNLAIQDKPDLSISLGTTVLRRGFENEMVISISNMGTKDVFDATVDLEFDADLSLASASIAWDDQIGSIYYWNIDTLLAGETKVINLMNYVDLNANLGDQKSITVNIGTSLDEVDYNNNSEALIEMIVGSLDPNDILVSPHGVGSSHLIKPDTRLRYKIRFQNVGNYPASFVKVIDTLPEFLDLISLELGIVSHAHIFRILEGNILEWYFRDINLLDSLHNESESHGFIEYSIMAKEGAANGSEIINKASIQFDYNPYLETNECLNTINLVENLPDDFFLNIFPNPGIDLIECYLVNDDVYETGEIKERGVIHIDVISDSGKRVQIYNFEADSKINHLDISTLGAGGYFIRYKDALG